MAYTSPRIQKTGAREPWKPRGVRGVPFMSWFSFSSKSPFSYDNWGRDIKRPYQLVLMPGYVAPKVAGSLSLDIDFMWYERPVTKPTIVWDGFDPYALMEIAYECFRCVPGAGHFRIRDAETKSWIDDPRGLELLSKRPARDFSMPDPRVDPAKYQLVMRDHRRRLARWIYESMVSVNKECDRVGRNASYDPEVRAWSFLNNIYSASLNPDSGTHPDNLARDTLAHKRIKANPGAAFMDASGYKSPVRFSELDVERQARQGFVAQSKRASEIAQERMKERQKALESVVPDAVVVNAQKSFWGKLFSFS